MSPKAVVEWEVQHAEALVEGDGVSEATAQSRPRYSEAEGPWPSSLGPRSRVDG